MSDAEKLMVEIGKGLLPSTTTLYGTLGDVSRAWPALKEIVALMYKTKQVYGVLQGWDLVPITIDDEMASVKDFEKEIDDALAKLTDGPGPSPMAPA